MIDHKALFLVVVNVPNCFQQFFFLYTMITGWKICIIYNNKKL